MRKLVIPLLVIFLLTGCVGSNRAPANVPAGSDPAPTPEETQEAIRIQPEELLFSVGESYALVCQSASGQVVRDVTWTIEEDSIATIESDGTVTAVAIGETIAVAERKDAPGLRATCTITVEERNALYVDGAKIEINDKEEDIIAQDGTNCTMIFEMQAVSSNGVFEGQAMLQSIGVKDAGSSIPAVGMVGLVSKVVFTLEPHADEEQPAGTEGDDGLILAPLVDVDYEGKGTFEFILTDVGFMALEIDVTDEDIFIEIPFEITVSGDTVGIGFNVPDGQFITFQGKLLKP